jgi:hypothetical protein
MFLFVELLQRPLRKMTIFRTKITFEIRLLHYRIKLGACFEMFSCTIIKQLFEFDPSPSLSLIHYYNIIMGKKHLRLFFLLYC